MPKLSGFRLLSLTPKVKLPKQSSGVYKTLKKSSKDLGLLDSLNQSLVNPNLKVVFGKQFHGLAIIGYLMKFFSNMSDCKNYIKFFNFSKKVRRMKEAYLKVYKKSIELGEEKKFPISEEELSAARKKSLKFNRNSTGKLGDKNWQEIYQL